MAGEIDRAVLDYLLDGGDPAALDGVREILAERLADFRADAIDEYRNEDD